MYATVRVHVYELVCACAHTYIVCACARMYACVSVHVCAHMCTGAQAHRAERICLLRSHVLLRVFLRAPCKALATLHLGHRAGVR